MREGGVGLHGGVVAAGIGGVAATHLGFGQHRVGTLRLAVVKVAYAAASGKSLLENIEIYIVNG